MPKSHCFEGGYLEDKNVNNFEICCREVEYKVDNSGSGNLRRDFLLTVMSFP